MNKMSKALSDLDKEVHKFCVIEATLRYIADRIIHDIELTSEQRRVLEEVRNKIKKLRDDKEYLTLSI